ncbi:UPF0047-domain-containing protein [Daldinia caldariorum]|uniref:UPF0047-domain-containing protein n=1 Tax=Daldinia caldariorum TaxID=326644 RepID=UPI0020076C47|nr:UPF0047-domain-containing protein [Daldinia caldariorum]KAI1464672.1 UPF0047-domain-containing protein [Daldinia caldariorum]
MPSSTITSASTSSFSHNFFTLFFLLVLLVAFFPGLFHYISTLPLAYLYPFSSSTSSPVSASPSPSPGSGSSSSSSTPPTPTMSGWFQKQFALPPRSRGSYLVTDHVVKELPELRGYKVGLLNLFVQHTSCALSLNENWDDDVRADMSDALDRIAPEAGPKGEDLYRHSAEGSDDMPAHIKSALIGASITIPIKDGKLATGTWQGIWYLEFRDMRHTRKVVATIQGEKA